MNHTFLILVGERLRETRKALGLSQDDAAAAVGVTRVQWGRYERGVPMPGGDVLAKCMALGIDIKKLLEPPPAASAGELRYSTEPMHTVLTVEERTLVYNYRASDTAGRRAIEAASAAMAKPPVDKPTRTKG